MTNKLEEKRRQWHQHIHNWKISGQSKKAYCHSHDLKPKQFYYWQHQFNDTVRHDPRSNDACVNVNSRFVPVQMNTTPAQSQGVYLEFPNGIRLHGLADTSPELLNTLIKAVS